MRIARVLTNETCNQGCLFCSARRPAESPDFVRGAAVLGRVDAALRAGAREIVFTGGEPTMRRDLAALVRATRDRGALRVVLETNGSLVDDASAAALARAGLDVARVHLPAFGPAADLITRDEGGFVLTVAGLRALSSAGILLEVSVPIVRANLSLVAEIPAGLVGLGISVSRIVVSVPVDAPEPSSLATFSEAAAAVELLAEAARRANVPITFEAGAMIPPCSFERPSRVAHLFALTPGASAHPRYERLADCAGCVVSDRCPGLPRGALLREPLLAVRPLREDRLRRRLTVISSTEEQIDRELVTRDFYRALDGSVVPSHIVRVQFHCNQACDFCFVSTHLPAPREEAVRAAILEISRLGGVLQLSGGEPTLNARLLEYVRLAKREGAMGVELQTNAIRIAEPGFAASLEQAGVDVAFVSLHGSTAEISDFVTRAPGTFDKTVRGIDALVLTRITVRLNFVVCVANQRDFPNFVRLVRERFPRAEINVSVVGAFSDLVPRTQALVPRFSDILPFLEEGLLLAEEASIVVHGFGSMCGMPLCLVPGDKRSYFSLAEIPEGHDRGEFVRAPACSSCELSKRCFGLRRSYAELYGTDEPRAVVRPLGEDLS